MLDFWIDSCIDLSGRKFDLYSGARKILHRRQLICDSMQNDLTMADCGFTKSKTAMLMRNYYVADSINIAIELWNRRIEQGKYGSVGFSCYGHHVKGGGIDQKRSKRASVMGPCLQSVVLTLGGNHQTHIDVSYRTTELFKKYPADLVFLRDNLLNHFDFRQAPITNIGFYFANVTLHPMYAVTFMPHLEDPVDWLEKLKKKDPYFWKWVCRWSARYLCEEFSRGILKFSQALRVRDDAVRRLTTAGSIDELQDYMRENNPPYRKEYIEDEE